MGKLMTTIFEEYGESCKHVDVVLNQLQFQVSACKSQKVVRYYYNYCKDQIIKYYGRDLSIIVVYNNLFSSFVHISPNCFYFRHCEPVVEPFAFKYDIRVTGSNVVHIDTYRKLNNFITYRIYQWYLNRKKVIILLSTFGLYTYI